MAGKRKAVSKGLRFEIFKRDGFTCQYCGERPPDVVLEIDHIMPVSKGGDNDKMNLVAACYACNRGKGAKLLDKPQRPDADLEWLELQQEIAELRRYQEAKLVRDEVMQDLVETLQDTWIDISGFDWAPAGHVIRKMLTRHSPGIVEDALSNVATKVAGGYIRKNDWLPYTWGTLKNMQEERHGITQDD